MILFRRGYTQFLQDYIAKEIDIKIDKRNKKAFLTKLKVKRKKTDMNKTLENVDKINNFFRKNKINLKAESYKISDIENPVKFIKEALDKDYDIQVEFANKPMYKTSGGHDCLISKLKKKERTYFVTLVDPDWGHKQVYDVPLNKLLNAMKKINTLKPARERGIMIIKPNF